MKVLVVDDDIIMRRLVGSTMRDLDYELHFAQNGEEAWAIAQRELPHVVISDWEMPRMNGIELVRKIRSTAADRYTYIFMVTHHRTQQDLLQGLSSGADDYLVKPFNPHELRLRLRTAERVVELESRLLAANKELAVMNTRLMHLSRRDPLMDIGNRMAFEESIAAHHTRAAANGWGYGVMMCDVDRFKRYNDTYGHQAGDEVLRAVATTLSTGLRADDQAFRYGGEEILVYFHEQDLAGAVTGAERMRRAVEALEFRVEGNPAPVSVTVSAGVAAFPQTTGAESRWAQVVDYADRALYKAKDSGRNCVVAAYCGDDGEIGFSGAGSFLIDNGHTELADALIAEAT